jgi:hypothetical protein
MVLPTVIDMALKDNNVLSSRMTHGHSDTLLARRLNILLSALLGLLAVGMSA